MNEEEKEVYNMWYSFYVLYDDETAEEKAMEKVNEL